MTELHHIPPTGTHKHRWTEEEIRDIYQICRDHPVKREALQHLRERFPDEAEYSKGSLELARGRYEKRNDGRAYIPFVPGEQPAAFGSQGKKWDSVWEEADWRRPAAPAPAPAVAAPAAPDAEEMAPVGAEAQGAPAIPGQLGDQANAELLFLRTQVRVFQDRLRAAELVARETRRRELNLLIFFKRAQVAHVRFVPYLFNVTQFEHELHVLEEELAML